MYETLRLKVVHIFTIDDTSTTPDLECIDGDVRLVDGPNVREGRVEICINRAWGTVCDELFNDADAVVICLQMEFSDIGTFNYIDTLSSMYYYVCVILHSCMMKNATSEHLLSLKSCAHFCGIHNLLVFLFRIHNVLAYVYNSDYCRTCAILGATALSEHSYTTDSGPIFLDQVDCRGNEARLLDCDRLRQLGLARCSHSSDAAVHCEGTVMFV